jgi:carboxyl-terminal processing protease
MNHRSWTVGRSVIQLTLLASAFALGMLVERSGRLLTPYYYTPIEVERTFAPFWETWHLVETQFVDRAAVKPEQMTRGAIHGMLATLGDQGHTTYQSPEEFKELKNTLAGNMEGIGASVAFRNRRPTILYTLSDSPATRAGLRAGDILLAVDGKDVAGQSLDRIVSWIRGPAGTVVRLRLTREALTEPLDLEVARASVHVPDVTWNMLPGVPIAHVAITSFGNQAHTQLRSALEGARARGSKALILDLRNDEGGLKDQAVALASEFLKDGHVLIERDAQDQRKPIAVEPGGTATDIPVCLVIDGTTASSAEIFAGALQDHERGKVVGTRSVGAGTVLGSFRLSDGSAVLLAVAEWLTPRGRRIWHQGITPDVVVHLPQDAVHLLPQTENQLTADALTKSEDKQVLKAVEILKEQLIKK